MKLYNSLTKKVEDFVPLQDNKVGLYTCGPTVYFYPQIGNWRTFVLGDLLHRSLKYLGYEVTYLMNITDVGHLTGDNLGDASQGEDRLEKGARREGKSAWEVARFYEDDFKKGYENLNLLPPITFCRATDHIDEQIEMIKKIESRGYTYNISDGLYFDVGAYEASGNTYGLMSNIHIDKSQPRITKNQEKKDARDFALWKFSQKDEKRQMEWDSPWGVGFPGWHIECSAMSAKYLGEQFDIHVGGEDHKSTHHPNEIAQSEAATGKKPFVKYWVHGAFLTVDGGRMGKSLGNAYTLNDIKERGYEYMALRYFYLTGHYRKPLNFTWEALDAAQKAFERLGANVVELKNPKSGERNQLSEDKLEKVNVFRDQFTEAISADLNLPQALAIMWEVVKSNIPSEDKLDLLYLFDEVLGLGLKDIETTQNIPDEILALANKRQALRKENNFIEADKIREVLHKMGWEISDDEDGQKLRPVKET